MSRITKKKYVVKEVLEEYPLPNETQVVSKIIRPRGNNLHQIITSTGEECIASMPVKFRKHVWVKRGDFILTETIPEGKKVRAEIVSVLFKDQIKHIKENNLWPELFAESDKKESDEDIKSDSDDEDELLFKNPNRRPEFYEDSSEDSDTDSENETDSDENTEDEEKY